MNAEAHKFSFDAGIKPFDLPMNFTVEEYNRFLLHCVAQNASDITLQPGDYGWVEVYGRQRPITMRKLQLSEIEQIARFCYADNAIAILSGGEAIDKRYEVQVDRSRRQGFRMNITAGRVGELETGFQITNRVIPDLPPKLEMMKLKKDLLDGLFPTNGAVIVAGVTGSGKSTLLASVIRNMLEEGEDRKILTYEKPIEFTFNGLSMRSPMPAQVEIGVHLPNFAAGVANALRRKPAVILVGEARDRETMDALIEAALTGHATYSTVHAESVAETIGRIVHMFPPDLQPAVANKLLGCLRLVIAQKLVKTLDGKRAALREYLYLNGEIKERLEGISYEKWPTILRQIVREKKQNMESAARAIYEQGLLDERGFLDAAGIKGQGAILEERPA